MPLHQKSESLLRRVGAVTTLPRAEGIFSAFKDTAGVRCNPAVFESTDRFDVRPLSVGGNSNDQLCVSKYRDVGVVRCDNDLPLLTYVSEDSDDVLVDVLIVQVVFRLIDDEWLVTA